ncbi:MAG: hypothetical protein EZS28_032819, partial [Streblomastix strix]
MIFAFFLLARLLQAISSNDDTVRYVQYFSTEDTDLCGVEISAPCHSIHKVLQDELKFDNQIIVNVLKSTEGDYRYEELTTNINNGRVTIIGTSVDDVIITGTNTRTDALFAVSNGRITLETLSLRPNEIGQKALIYMDGTGDVNLDRVQIKNLNDAFNYFLIEATAGRILLQNSYFDNIQLVAQSLIKIHPDLTALTILTCEFFNSSNLGGSGSILTADVGPYTTIQFISTLFSGSSASGNGGACVINGVDSPVTSVLIIENCQFVQNSGTNGGALYLTKSFYSFEFLYNSFEKNSASSSGNDIYWDNYYTSTDILKNTEKVFGSFSTSAKPRVRVNPYQESEQYENVFPENSANESTVVAVGESIDDKIGVSPEGFKSVLLEADNYSMKSRTIDTYGLSITGSSQLDSYLERTQSSLDEDKYAGYFFSVTDTPDRANNSTLRLSSLTITRYNADDIEGAGFVDLEGGALRLQRITFIVKDHKYNFTTPHVIEHGSRKGGHAVINGVTFTDASFKGSAAVKRTDIGNLLQIENCLFTDLIDNSDAGAAIDIDIYITEIETFKTTIQSTLFRNCTSYQNESIARDGVGAGAISITCSNLQSQSSNADIFNKAEHVEINACQFENNEGNNAGAISVTGLTFTTLYIKYCTFKNNVGKGYSRQRASDVFFNYNSYKQLLDRGDIFTSCKTTSDEPQIQVLGSSDTYHELMRDFFVDLTIGFIGDDDRDNYGRGGPEEPYLSVQKALDESKDHKSKKRSIRIQRGTYNIEGITLNDRTIDIIGVADIDWKESVLRSINTDETNSAITVKAADVQIESLVILAFLPRRSGYAPLIKLDDPTGSLRLEKVEISDPKDSSDKHLTFDKPLIEVLRGYEFKLTK